MKGRDKRTYGRTPVHGIYLTPNRLADEDAKANILLHSFYHRQLRQTHHAVLTQLLKGSNIKRQPNLFTIFLWRAAYHIVQDSSRIRLGVQIVGAVHSGLLFGQWAYGCS